MGEEHFEPEAFESFLSAIHDRYGYDFRNYAHASLRRRIRHRLKLSGVQNLTELKEKVLHERGEFDALLFDLSVTTTEMFRDPSFFTAFREEVVPWLRTFPSFKIWQAGCSTGQESYSLAIVLEEEKLLNKALIYATDYNPVALEKARGGIFPAEVIQEYTANFHDAGGKGPFSQHFTSQYGKVLMNKKFKDRIVFAEHNLVTDTTFSEVHIVVCRNVLIYFNRVLQDRVLNMFKNSLIHRGYLCLGAKESLILSGHAKNFEAVKESEKIYRRKE